MNTGYYYKRGVIFAEKPVTSEEKSVAALLEAVYSARKKKNIEGLLSLYENNAKIYSLAPKRKLDLEQYRRFLDKNFVTHIHSYFDQAIIRIKSPSKAFISAIALYQYQTHSIGPAPILFTLKKNNGKWLIAQSEWT